MSGEMTLIFTPKMQKVDANADGFGDGRTYNVTLTLRAGDEVLDERRASVKEGESDGEGSRPNLFEASINGGFLAVTYMRTDNSSVDNGTRGTAMLTISVSGSRGEETIVTETAEVDGIPGRSRAEW